MNGQLRSTTSPRVILRRLLNSTALESAEPEPVEESRSTQLHVTQSHIGNDVAVEGEVRDCFPHMNSIGHGRRSGVVRQARAPYTPRRTYTAPAIVGRRNCAGAGFRGIGNRSFCRDVVLLDQSDPLTVPRGDVRSQFHDAKRIANLVEFDMSWSDAQVREKIERVFKDVFDMAKPPPRFEFLKACYGKLKTPNVDVDFTWTGEKVKLNSSQGDIYVRAIHPLLKFKEQTPPTQDSYEQGASGFNTTMSGTRSQASSDTRSEATRSDAQSEATRSDARGQTTRSDAPGPSGSNASSSGSIPTSSCFVPPPPISPIRFDFDFFKELTDADVKRVLEMFPGENEEEIRLYFTEKFYTFDEVVDVLLKKSEPKSPPSLYSIIHSLSAKLINLDEDLQLCMNRSCIWNKAKSFYKVSLKHPERLKKNLMVRFAGEEGIDGGALRNEFFEVVMKHLNEEFFEGPDDRRLPSKSWGFDFTMAGAMVAHSILSGGPGLSCLNPSLYSWWVGLEEEEEGFDMPSVADIPVNAANEDLLSMIDEINEATDEESLNVVVFQDKYVSLINQSGWPQFQLITWQNRTEFIQRLVMDEVVTKRERQMRDFSKGMDLLGLFEVVKKNKDTFRSAFLHTEQKLASSLLCDLVSSKRPHGALAATHATVYDWFFRYVTERGADDVQSSAATLEDILQFVTGLRKLPPLGLCRPIEISYLPSSRRFIYPRAQSCFNVLKLPTFHQDYKEFAEKMDQGIRSSNGYFGLA